MESLASDWPKVKSASLPAVIPLAALLPLARSVAPAIVAAGLGWSVAWYVQGLRLQSSRNDLAAVQTQHAAAINAAKERANAQHDETARAWAAAVDHLRRRRADGWLPVLPASSPGSAIPAAGRADGAGADAVPAAAGDAAQCLADLARVTSDAQQTTLMLNELQAAVERQ